MANALNSCPEILYAWAFQRVSASPRQSGIARYLPGSPCQSGVSRGVPGNPLSMRISGVGPRKRPVYAGSRGGGKYLVPIQPPRTVAWRSFIPGRFRGCPLARGSRASPDPCPEALVNRAFPEGVPGNPLSMRVSGVGAGKRPVYKGSRGGGNVRCQLSRSVPVAALWQRRGILRRSARCRAGRRPARETPGAIARRPGNSGRRDGLPRRCRPAVRWLR